MLAQLQRTKQIQKQSVITSTSSLAAINIFMHSALGCITFLRDLLPENNFTSVPLSELMSGWNTENKKVLSVAPFSSTPPNTVSKAGVSGRVCHIKRGYSQEADMLCRFFDEGVNDAITKGYLKTVILSIFLDENDPNNIVEAYTFSFAYAEIGGMRHPSVGIERNSKNDKAFSTNLGLAKNMTEVETNIKSVIKALVVNTQQLRELPAKRFMALKLFYHSHTPDDYQPSSDFMAANEDEPMHFDTHNTSNAPERVRLRDIQTGYHGVAVSMASVVYDLPSVPDTSAMTTRQRRQALEAHDVQVAQDCKTRCVAWAAEEEIIPATEEGVSLQQMSLGTVEQPLGVRGVDGQMESIPAPHESIASQMEPLPREHSKLNDNLHARMHDDEHPSTQACDLWTPPPSSQYKRGDDNILLSNILVEQDQEETPIAEMCSVQCDCGSTESTSADKVLRCAACDKYVDAVCYGFESAADPRLDPNIKFACMTCRLFLEFDEDPKMQEKYLGAFQTLVLFRRCLKAVETCPTVISCLHLAACLTFKVDTVAIRQMLHRLKTEKFVVVDTSIHVMDFTGRAQLKRPMFRAPLFHSLLQAYFNPGKEKEAEVMTGCKALQQYTGLKQTHESIEIPKSTPDAASIRDRLRSTKRMNSDATQEITLASKRLKTSRTTAVELARYD